MHDIFVSYSQADRYFVEKLVSDMRSVDVDVFYNQMLIPGSFWVQSIDTKISESEFFAPVLTNDYLESDECMRQLEKAINIERNRQLIVIPILLSDCNIPEILKSKIPADFSFKYDIGLNDLLITVLHLAVGTDHYDIPGDYRNIVDDTDYMSPEAETDWENIAKFQSPNVFLCHANEDKPTIDRIYYYLGSAGINPWYDKKVLIGGDRWESEISKAISRSDFFIIFLSKNSVNKRGFIQNEIRMAVKEFQNVPQNEIFFIPVRLDNCKVPDIKLDSNSSLADFQWIDLDESNPMTIWKLIKTIKSQWNRRKIIS